MNNDDEDLNCKASDLELTKQKRHASQAVALHPPNNFKIVLIKFYFMNNKKNGVMACIILAAGAALLGKYFPLIGGPVFGISIGLCLALALKKKISLFSQGASFAGKTFLQLSIILLGFEMNIFTVIQVGADSLLIMLFTLSAAFLAAYLFGKLLGIDPIITVLIGVGTAICGGSAIAATAPVVRAKDHEIAHSISTIFLFNIAAVFIFPAIGHFFQMSNTGFGIWAGTAVNDTSSVLATSFAYSNESGALATIVKLARTLMIIPITFVLSLYFSGKGKNGESNGENNGFKLSKAFPYFIIGFLVAALVNTSGLLPLPLVQALAGAGKFLIVVAMVGIGLNTNLIKLLKNGIKPIMLGLLCWITLAATALLVQKWMGLL